MQLNFIRNPAGAERKPLELPRAMRASFRFKPVGTTGQLTRAEMIVPK